MTTARVERTAPGPNRHGGVEEIEHLVRRTRVTLTGTTDGGGIASLTSEPVALGFRWIVDLLDVFGVGAWPSNRPSAIGYLNSVGPSNGVWGQEDQNLISSFFSPFHLNYGDRLLFSIFDATPNTEVGVNIMMRLYQLETKVWGTGSSPSSGFPAPFDAEPGSPAYNSPDETDLIDRDPAVLPAHAGDQAGYGAGALYPDRNADTGAPAAFPWPDGPAVPGGDY